LDVEYGIFNNDERALTTNEENIRMANVLANFKAVIGGTQNSASFSTNFGF
jgi:hypothetical protein